MSSEKLAQENQCLSWGFSNSSDSEIKIRLARNNNIVVSIQKDTLDETAPKNFVMSLTDEIALDRFELMLQNVVNYQDTFSLRQGTKQNKSELGISSELIQSDGKAFKVQAVKCVGIQFKIYNVINSSYEETIITFTEHDSEVLRKFVKQFSHVVKNSVEKLSPIVRKVSNENHA